MSGNSFGKAFRVSTFGESHGPALGAVIDGVPAGLRLDLAEIQRELDRRRPGQSKVSTTRDETDCAEFLSGVLDNVTTGTSLGLLIRNSSQRSKDYDALARVFRPGHADYGYFQKYGIRDHRGGGRSSGRETAMRVAAGAIAKQLIAHAGVKIQAYAIRIGGITAQRLDLDAVEQNIVRSADPDRAEAMIEAIRRAQAETDSVGGIIECRADGVPAGWGEPVFDKLDAMISHAILSIGGIKGIEFGAGFGAADLRGSQNNDAIGKAGFQSNHAGGILGGISTGQPVIFRAVQKATPSIAQQQQTVNLDGDEESIQIHGRHDPCLIPRTIPVVEAMTALVLADAMLRNHSSKI